MGDPMPWPNPNPDVTPNVTAAPKYLENNLNVDAMSPPSLTNPILEKYVAC